MLSPRLQTRSLQEWVYIVCSRHFDHNSHGMDIVACSVLNKDITDKTNNTNKFKKRSNQEKRFKYQQKDVCSLSKIIIIIISPLNDINEKISSF